MENFERAFVYKCPGPYGAGKDGTYDCAVVESQADLETALEEGWSKTMPEAAAAAKAPSRAVGAAALVGASDPAPAPAAAGRKGK